MLMKAAIVSLCRALGQILDAHYKSFDRETSDLIRSLAAYVEKHDAS
jgi:hypothetical protein